MFVIYNLQLKIFSHFPLLNNLELCYSRLINPHIHDYNPQIDLSMYKKNELESTFVEILTSEKADVIMMESNYKDVSMDLLNLSIVFYSNF